MSERGVVVATRGLGKQFLGGVRHRSLFRALRSQIVRRPDAGTRMSLDSIEIEISAGETLGLVGQN